MPRIFAPSPALEPREVSDKELKDWVKSGWLTEDPTKTPASKSSSKTN